MNSDSAVSPAVSCTVEVTAYRPDGTPYADKAGCSFDGGNTRKCTRLPICFEMYCGNTSKS